MQVKVCGLTSRGRRPRLRRGRGRLDRPELPPGSPRRVDPTRRGRDRRRPARLGARRSACSSIARPARSPTSAERLGLRIVQLHGDEPPEDLVALGHLPRRPRLPPRRRRGDRADGRLPRPRRDARPAARRRPGRRLRPRPGRRDRPVDRRRPPRPPPPPAPPDPGRRPDARERRRPRRPGPPLDGRRRQRRRVVARPQGPGTRRRVRPRPRGRMRHRPEHRA